MKLSVLLNFYNQTRYVDQALESVTAQRVNFAYEILIGDDGSDDGTLEKLEDWRRRYPDLIREIVVMDRGPGSRQDPRGRVSLIRKTLITKAAGQYLAVLDGDDFYTDPHKFQLQVDILDHPDNADCSMCGHNVNYCWDDRPSRPVNDPREGEGKIKPRDYWGRARYISSISLIFRNVYQGTFPREFNDHYVAETLMVCHSLKFGGIYYLPRVMGCYRQHPGSIWNSHDETAREVVALILYDLSRRLNPGLGGANLRRHFSAMRYAYQNRRRLGEARYDYLREKAALAGGEEALKWLNYQNSGPARRLAALLSFHKNRLLKHCHNLTGG